MSFLDAERLGGKDGEKLRARRTVVLNRAKGASFHTALKAGCIAWVDANKNS